MVLKQLSLLNYKNFNQRDFTFNPKMNCIVGANGIGKTNVLDAIYHLSFGKSYFNPISSQNIRHGEDFFVIDAILEKEEKSEKLICSMKKGAKKVVKRNGKVYEKLADHIGFMPLVMISPADRDLITEGSETRRKFIDGVISQSDKNYLNTLLNYQKVLSQRNALLKYFAANQTFDSETLSVYNSQLSQLAQPIYEKRKAFLNDFMPIFTKRYQSISNSKEIVEIQYRSQLNEQDLLILLKENATKDKISQYSNFGIHKDDLIFDIEEHPIKKFGSQGQQKSFLIALKLAQFDFIKTQSKVNPILLMDDVFDKLDEQRVEQIIALVKNQDFGQLFISDTHADRTEKVIKKIHQSYKMFKL